MIPRVHAITDASVLAQPDFLEVAMRVASAGNVAIHLRDRTAPAARLARLAEAVVPALQERGAKLFINARPDIARAAGADGVQLGERDLGVADARVVFPSGLIGRSVHDEAGARIATADEADFLMLGPIWGTATHPGSAGLGLEVVRSIARPQTLDPRLLLIGGVTLDRARQAKAAGAHGIAAIRAIWNAPDPARAVKEFLEVMEAA